VACETFESRNFREPTLAMIARVNTIIGEYDALGFIADLAPDVLPVRGAQLGGQQQERVPELCANLAPPSKARLVSWSSF
jgi:hypothetical protein